MSTNPSGALPPMGQGASRPAGLNPIGGAVPGHKAELEPIRIDNLGMGTLAAEPAKPASNDPAGGAPPAALLADEKQYKRKPVVTGRGAFRCKTFHVKLNDAALAYMDEMVNTWLEQHGYEAKFSQMTIGIFQGKTMDQHLIVQVWY